VRRESQGSIRETRYSDRVDGITLAVSILAIVVAVLGFSGETLAGRLYPKKLRWQQVERVSETRSLGRLTMSFPVASGPGSEFLNSAIEALCLDALVEFNKMEDERDDEKEPVHEPNVNVRFQADSIVSVVCGSDYFSMYRANVYQRFEARTLNLESGALLRVRDVIASTDSLTTEVRRLCIEVFGDEEDEESVWMTDYRSLTIDPDSPSFLFWSNGFALAYSKYEIGPGVAGCAAISLSWKDIERLLAPRMATMLSSIPKLADCPSTVEYGIDESSFVSQTGRARKRKMLRGAGATRQLSR
jgi:hypothetical protein